MDLLMVFYLEAQLFAVDCKLIDQVQVLDEMTPPPPLSPKGLHGLLHWGGNIVPLWNLKTILKLSLNRTSPNNPISHCLFMKNFQVLKELFPNWDFPLYLRDDESFALLVDQLVGQVECKVEFLPSKKKGALIIGRFPYRSLWGHFLNLSALWHANFSPSN